MKKFIYMFLGMALLLLMGQTSPEYLYRNLSIRSPGYAVVDINEIFMSNIHWEGGTFVDASGYYQSNGVNDNLYGYFSMPVHSVGAQVVIDSISFYIWTQASGDFVDIYLRHWGEGVAATNDFNEMGVGNGDNGWDKYQILNIGLGETVTSRDSCYQFHFDCTNDGASDIRVRMSVELRYKLDTLQ